MAEFNAGATAAAVHAAQEEPVVRFGDRTYRGRLLSIEAWLPFYERLQALELVKAKAVDAGLPFPLRQFVALWVDYLSAVFPRSDYRFWAPDPVKALRELPGNGLREAFEHFFSRQVLVLGATVAPPVSPAAPQATTSDGPSSSAATPAAPAVVESEA